MTTEGKVSPLRLPLCAVVDDGDGGAIIDAKGGLIAATEFMGESEQIVRAVNAHDRLVAAIERFIAAADDSCDARHGHDDMAAMLEYNAAFTELRAALAAAKGGK